MSVVSFIRDLLNKDVPLEQALVAAEVYEANPPKSPAAVRQQRYRDRNKPSRTVTRYVSDAPPDKEKSPTPPKEINPPASLPNGSSAAGAARYDQLLQQLLAANGVSGFRDERAPGLANLAPILGLIEAGYDIERDILATIRARRKPEARSWAYFVPAIREAGDTRRGIASQPVRSSQPEPWAERLAAFRQDGTWIHAWGPKPGEAGCRVPDELARAA